MPARLTLDLSRTWVFLDFDGTITQVDSGVHLLEKLATGPWREIDRAYALGEIGSRECLLDEWELLPKDQDRLLAVARETPIDPGFTGLVHGLRSAGAEVTVVSDGFGFYADEVCRSLDVDVLTNAVDWITGRLEFPHQDRCCACSTCGTCKQAPLKDARHWGQTTVMVGDGTTDRKAALLADVVFAKGELAAWCAANGVEHVVFDTLADVHTALLLPDADRPTDSPAPEGAVRS